MGRAVLIPLLIIAGAAAVASRTGAAVRVVRTLDQRGGLFAPRGARLYARVAPRLLRGLYRRVADDLVGRVGSGSAPTIIDLGSGPGQLAIELARRLPGARVIGVDPAAPMRDAAARAATLAGVATATFVHGEAGAIPLPDASADLLVSTLSMHHWPDPAAALREIARVLRPGGEALLYDARFVTYSDRELRRFTKGAGLDNRTIVREVLPWGRVRPWALVTMR
ncbi:MAG: class I SAM-dependent methyltransferase [Chloroflexota bacterium]